MKKLALAYLLVISGNYLYAMRVTHEELTNGILERTEKDTIQFPSADEIQSRVSLSYGEDVIQSTGIDQKLGGRRLQIDFFVGLIESLYRRVCRKDAPGAITKSQIIRVIFGGTLGMDQVLNLLKKLPGYTD